MAAKIPSFDEAVKDGEALGFILSAALDFLGYSYDIMKERQQRYKLWSHVISHRMSVHSIVVGSKAEGLTLSHENDIDLMNILDRFICVEELSDGVMYNRNVLLLVEMNEVSPGYAKLKVPYPVELLHSHIKGACFKNRLGDVYVSSVLFKDLLDLGPQFISNGPAYTCADNVFPLDGVSALPFKCKKLMQEWENRPRYRGWPNEQVLQEVSQLDWHVVSVGSTKEGEGFQEWRICFTLGEKCLIQTFNHAQLQLVVLLKYISAKILKPVCPAISSYIMKNIVLWMAELLPRNIFKIQNLTRLLMLSLATLRRTVDRVSLKNYMIPARNMFLGKISRDEREILMAHLDSFLLDGPSFILQDARLSRLSEAMYQVFKDPEESELRQRREDIGEVNFQTIVLSLLQCSKNLN